jgi:preprotein translocase subunit SecA
MNIQKTLSEIKREAYLLKEKTQEEIKNDILQVKKKVNEYQKKKEKKNSFGEEIFGSQNILNQIIPQWFAIVQEISSRTIGLKHFDTQLKAGFFLHQGNIVEMKTGEGKTLSSTLPISLNALLGEGVHAVTVNDYLAERDQKWMGKVYNELGLTSGLVKSTSTDSEKQKSYDSDITYLTNSELVFDYLRDCSVLNFNEIVQRPFSFCILDEIDSILIDEARTPLILSTAEGLVDKKSLFLANFFARRLEEKIDFQIQEKQRDIFLTEIGYENIIELLGKGDLFKRKNSLILEILNALKALHLFKKNKDYIVLNNKVVLVDEFTGRIMEDRRWSLGIHEAVEIKENVPIGDITKTKSSITYQNFFMLYPKLAGMTGTAKTAEVEFQDLYQLNVVVLETNKPLIRKDSSDNIYQSELAKWKAVLKQSRKCFEIGQPILIGTASVEKSEFLSSLFESAKIPHQVLNAKPENLVRENQIIAQAGKKYAVTIATNMAGRGTDIILGGNFLFDIKEQLCMFFSLSNNKQEFFFEKQFEDNIEKIKLVYKKKSNGEDLLETHLQNLPYSLETCDPLLKDLYDKLSKEFILKWEKENKEIKENGGLFVLGTERHETRRIDNQLRGRAGRQGDPGISHFFVSLEDDLLTIFGGTNIQKWVQSLMDDKDEPLESDFLTKSLENAQKKIEAYNYEIRKNVYQYDSILNSQRKKLFRARYELLCENIYYFLSFQQNEFFYCVEQKNKKTNKIHKQNEKNFYSSYKISRKNKIVENNSFKDIWIISDLRWNQSNLYESGFLKQKKIEEVLYLLDQQWTEHLERTNYARETINWRSYGQQKPLDEYNMETIRSFQQMFQHIRFSMLYSFLYSSLLIE